MAQPVDTARLFAQHRADLLRFFARRTADPEVALDLVAETFAQAVRSRRRCRGTTEDEQAAWLYAIARSQLASYHRRGYAEQRAVRRLGLERPPVSDAVLRDIEVQAGLRDVRARLAEALGELTDETRSAIELRVVGELPYAEVAERLGIAEAAARTRVSRGLSRLADLIDPTLLDEVRA